MATTVAGEEPEIAAKNIHASTPAMASPPRIQPTSALVNSMRRADTPPVVSENLLSPIDGTLFTEGRIAISGRVEDDIQIAEVEVAIVDGNGHYMRSDGSFSPGSSWRNAFINSPGSPGSNFSYTSPPVPAGDYTVFVRGIDQRGFATEVPGQIEVSVTVPPNDPPVADFTYSCEENVCTFDGRSSTDDDVATLDYSWSFGNGSGSRLNCSRV